MKKLLVILTLILTWVWAYTSWYWYTCSIKWFCDIQENKVETPANLISGNDVFMEENITETEISSSGIINNTSNAQKLSADDVLSETKIKKTETKPTKEDDTKEISEEENPKIDETQEVEVNITVLSWALDTPLEEKTDKEENLVKQEDQDSKHILCTNPIVGPIGIGIANNSQEVRNLEDFLASQWETVTRDGIYGKDEFEAMKRFQLKYRADILDPWDIAEPTGYVYKTTIKKIHELACK